MKFLVSALHFYPDHSGIALYSSDFAFYLAEQGHEVTVVTGFPFYPRWEKRTEDRRRLFHKEEVRGVTLLRGYVYVPTRRGTLARIVHELSFLLFAFLNYLRAGRHQTIVVFSPPLLLGMVSWAFARLWGAKLVLNIQDLQVDAAVSLGMMREGLLVRALRACERFLYRRADLVATISEGMRQHMAERGAQEVQLCYNWIDVEGAAAERPPGRFLEDHPQFRGGFLVAYAGNLGVKQGLDVMLDLAEDTVDLDDIHYLIIGEGADRERLQGLAARRGISNLTFLPLLASEAYQDMLEDIDVSFVAQRAGSGDVFFPSKLLGITARAKPLLISADTDSELGRVAREGGFGSVVGYGDRPALARALRTLYEDEALREGLAAAGFRWVQQFGREVVLHSFLQDIVESGRDRPPREPGRR